MKEFMFNEYFRSLMHRPNVRWTFQTSYLMNLQYFISIGIFQDAPKNSTFRLPNILTFFYAFGSTQYFQVIRLTGSRTCTYTTLTYKIKTY